MAKTQFTKEIFFPSLLDRIVDDEHINSMMQQCKQRIDILEKKLANTPTKTENPIDKKTDKKTDKKARQQWLESRHELLRQLTTLQASTGSLNEIRACVKRDLEWLFNTHNLCLDELLQARYPQVEKSVLNYGLPDLTGKTASSINMLKLEKILKNTIKKFEPRIIAKTLQVHLLKEKSVLGENALLFEIKGDLWTGYRPIALQITTQLDLENGNVEIRE
jgi:type VI secretion system lysozyme-like protein